jgi:hypothetical protein
MDDYKKDELGDLEHKILVEINLNCYNIILNDLLKKNLLSKEKQNEN